MSGLQPDLRLLLLLLALLLPTPVRAQDENRAGLIIVHGDGSVVQQCVRFGEESISGYDLLSRAGLPLSVEAGGFGTTVCSIGGEGCGYPAESCFCQCQGSPCVYWSYWRLQDDGAWRYQPLGAGNTQVQDGAVEAWRWAAGTTRDAPEPPPASFADICAADNAPVAMPTASHVGVRAGQDGAQTGQDGAPAGQDGAQVGQDGAQVGQDGAQAGQAPTEEIATASVTPSPAHPLTPSPVQPIWLILAGAVILPAAVLLFWALLRRGR